jgi:hypothetical protein
MITLARNVILEKKKSSTVRTTGIENAPTDHLMTDAIALSLSYLKGDITDLDVIEGPLSEKLDLSGATDSNKFFLLGFLLSNLRFLDRGFFNRGFFYFGHGELISFVE